MEKSTNNGGGFWRYGGGTAKYFPNKTKKNR